MAPLLAGPPALTDDPFVPALGTFEINLATEVVENNRSLIKAPLIDMNYGFKNLEVTLRSSYISDGSQEDFDSVKVEVKWLFYQGDTFAMAIHPKYLMYPIDTVFDDGEAFEMGLPMNLRINKRLDLVMNLTYFKPKYFKKHFEFGSYLKYTEGRNSYFLEAYFEESALSHEISYLSNLGYRLQYSKDRALLVSVGRDLKSENEKRTLAYVALQLIL